MTVLLPCARTLSSKLLTRSSNLLTRLGSTYPSLRVSYANGRDAASNDFETSTTRSIVVESRTRPYATAARPVGRPKAHTGRTTTKRITKKTTTTKKAEPKKKAAPRRAKAKPKAKTKPKPKPTKRVLTAQGQARKDAAQRRDLKEKALMTGTPKNLPATAWTVCFVEHAPKKGETAGIDGGFAKRAAQAYRNMSPEEHERLNRIANENKAKNEVAYKKWVSLFTPLQIKEANVARDHLKRIDPKAKKHSSKYTHIKDDRLVKQPTNAYAMFLQDRVASGDMNGMKIPEIGKLVAREFKDMSAAQKKTYEDKYAADRNRYYEEFKTVYGILPASASRPTAAAAA